jgi:hypothetical protein
VFSAAVVHAAINTFAALGGQTTAIAVMMMGWAILVHFMTKAESTRPYGTYIHQVDLLKTITDAEQELVDLKGKKNPIGLHPERKLFAHAFRRKLVKNQKQFAKT